MLGDPPVAVLPDQHPGHPVRAGLVAIGEIDMPRRDGDVWRDRADMRHGIVLDADGAGPPAEIGTYRRLADLQLVNGTEQGGIVGVKRHVPVEIMAVESLDPLRKQALYCRRVTHAILPEMAS